jgi:hypothetical protein
LLQEEDEEEEEEEEEPYYRKVHISFANTTYTQHLKMKIEISKKSARSFKALVYINTNII